MSPLSYLLCSSLKAFTFTIPIPGALLLSALVAKSISSASDIMIDNSDHITIVFDTLDPLSLVICRKRKGRLSGPSECKWLSSHCFLPKKVGHNADASKMGVDLVNTPRRQTG